jgi:hypothetical protein
MMASKINANWVQFRIRLRGNLQNFVCGESNESESVQVNKVVLFLAFFMRMMRLVKKVETFSNHCHHLIKQKVAYTHCTYALEKGHWPHWLFFSMLDMIVVRSLVLLNQSQT